MNPGFLEHLLLICQFELKRLFFTRKGLLYLITFSLVWCFILLYPIRFAANILSQGQYSAHGSSFFEFIGFGSLLNWQVPEFGVFWRFGLILFPSLCVMIAADQTSSDRERGTLRFLALRAGRDSIFFGRFFGSMTTQLILIIVTVLTTLTFALVRNPGISAIAFSSVLAITVNLLLVLLPFTAMMAVLSASFKSAKQATVWAILIWTFLSGIISGLSYYLPALDNLKILIPGYQLSELSQLSEWQTLELAYIPLIQTVVLLMIGRWIILRQTL